MGILDVLGLRVAKDEDYNDEPVYGKRNDDIDEEMMFDGEESYGEEEFENIAKKNFANYNEVISSIFDKSKFDKSNDVNKIHSLNI